MAGIVQRIALEGGTAVIRELQNIGERGAAAFRNLEAASNRVNFRRLEDSFRNIGIVGSRAFEGIVSAASKLSGVFGLGVAGGVAGLSTSLGVLSSSAAEAVDNMDDLATQASTTAESMGAILSVFRQTGTGASEVADKMRKFAVSVQKAWEDIKTSVQNAGRVQEQNKLNVEGATLSLEQANLNLAKSYKALSAAAGDPLKSEQALLDLRQNQLAVARAELAVTEARQKEQNDEANSIENLRGAVLGLARGTGDLSRINVTAENVFKGIVAAAGPSIDSLKELSTDFNQLASASAPGAQKSLYLLADVFKNLKDETLKTAIAAHAFGRGVDVDLVKALSKGSEAFKERERELKALGLAFGEADTKASDAFKDASRTFTDFLTLLKDKVGITITPVFTTIYEGLTGLIKNNVASLKETAEGFRETFQPIAQGLANVLKAVSFDDFKKEAKDAFTPEQYIRVELWQQRFLVIKEGLTVVIAGFRLFKDVVSGILNSIASIINRVFGTQLSGSALGVALLVARFSGLIPIITTIVSLIGSLGSAIASIATIGLSAISWPALLAAAVIGLAILIYQNWDKIKAATAALMSGIGQLWAGLVSVVQVVVDAIVRVWNTAVTNVKAAWDGVATWFSGLIENLSSLWSAFTANIKTAWDGAVGYVKDAWNAVSEWFKSVIDTMTGWWVAFVDSVKAAAQSIADKARALAGVKPAAGAGGALGAAVEAPARAGGGMVHGPGTGTSDSIPARLSAGEYVVRAAAVRRVGVGLLDRINNAPGMAMGGLVSTLRDGLASIAPRFAAGGLAPSSGGLRPFTLVMPGGGSFGGLFAQESSVSHMRRAAVHAQVASTGRRPGWVK